MFIREFRSTYIKQMYVEAMYYNCSVEENFKIGGKKYSVFIEKEENKENESWRFYVAGLDANSPNNVLIDRIDLTAEELAHEVTDFIREIKPQE